MNEYYHHNMRRHKEDVPKHVRERQYRQREPGVDWKVVESAPDDHYFNRIEPNFFEAMRPLE